MKHPRMITIAMFVVVVLFLGCSESGVVTDSGSSMSQRNPRGTLRELENAINDENILGYGDCLTSDYEYHFDDDFVGTILENNYVIPEYWTRAEDIDAMDELFEDTEVVSVSFDIKLWQGNFVFDDDQTHAVGTFPVEFTLYGLTPVDGIEVIAESESTGIFTFVRIPTADGSYRWKIEKWEDEEIFKTSLGRIKAFYAGKGGGGK